MHRRARAALAVSPLLLCLAAGAAADIFPTTAPTAGGNTIPFGTNTDFHEVFASSLFGNVTGGQPALITRIDLAPLDNLRYKTGLIVRLGYTAAPPGGLSPPPSNSASNNGAPNATVPPGMTDFYLAPGYLNVFAGASDANFQAPLEGTPFVYDPAQGNLLVELVVSSPSFDSLRMSATNAPGEASRAYFNSVAGSGVPGSLRMSFTFAAHNPANTGACCAADGSCTAATIAQCQAQAGVYKGDNIACASAPCSQPGACCKADGTCVPALNSACIADGGTWHGAGTSCAPVTCPQPGACCASDGTCTNRLAADCSRLGAVWNQSPCTSGTCTPHVLIAIPATCGFPFTCNGGTAAADAGLYMNLTAGAATSVAIRRFECFSNTTVGTPASVTLWTREGSYAGFDGSTAGWTNLGTIPTTSSGTNTNNPPVRYDLPAPVFIQQGRTQAFCLVANSGGLRYRTSDPAPSNPDLALSSALSRFPAFTGAAVVRGLVGAVGYDTVSPAAQGACCAAAGGCTIAALADCIAAGGTFRGEGSACAGAGCPPPACYPNCDASTAAPILNVADFTCFLQKFSAGDAYANCDNSTTAPILNVADFTCFLQSFTAGCP